MKTRPVIPATQEAEKQEDRKVKVSLGYKVSSRLVWATQWQTPRPKTNGGKETEYIAHCTYLK